MSNTELLATQGKILAALARLRALEEGADAQQHIDNIKFYQRLKRINRDDTVHIIGGMVREAWLADNDHRAARE